MEATLAGVPEARKRGVCLKILFKSEFNSWRAMRERCSNPKYRRYDLYGGRGIAVCKQWSSFRRFLADMGQKPTPRHSIERIDGNAGYEPANCRWATQLEQMNNMSRNRMISAQGETMTLQEWSRRTSVPSHVILKRLARGWTVEDALFRVARRSPIIYLEHNGKRQSLLAWSKELGIKYTTLHRRHVVLGWPVEQSLSTQLR